MNQGLFVAEQDLTSFDPAWQIGDKINYQGANGIDLQPLVGGDDYFLIAYRPGWTECGLIQNNKLDNNLEKGIRDDRCPTSSAWVKNTVFGKDSCKQNYCINWAGKAPVNHGSLADYPTGCEQAFNLSLVKEKFCKRKLKCEKPKCEVRKKRK